MSGKDQGGNPRVRRVNLPPADEIPTRIEQLREQAARAADPAVINYAIERLEEHVLKTQGR